MSAYKVIKTSFKSLTSLLAALKEMGYTDEQLEVAADHKVNGLTLFGYHNDARPEKAVVCIPRKYVGHVSNDIGFMWDGQAYQAIVSDYDQSATFTAKKMNQLKQLYAIQEVRRQARSKGYNLRENRMSDGTVRLTLERR